MRKALGKLAKEAYAEVAFHYGEHFGNNPGEIYWKNTCQQFCEAMWRMLKDRGIQSKYKSLDVKSINSPARHHLVLETSDYLIDGTWQQFEGGAPHPDQPCLILRKNALEEDLEKASVPRKLWPLYGARSVADKAA